MNYRVIKPVRIGRTLHEADTVLDLSEREARYPLLAGAIEPVAVKKPAKDKA